MVEPRPDPARFAAGVVLVAATYIFFLLYAQFGLVFMLEGSGQGAEGIRRAMGAMGVAGLAGSVLTARALARRSAAGLLRAGFALSALSALVVFFAPRPVVFPLAAIGVGAGVALVTLPLAASLEALFGPRRIGAGAGLGTAIAYAVCNLPGVFDGPAATHTGVSVLACLAAIVVTTRAFPSGLPAAPPDRPRAPPGEGGRMAGALAAFLALVWLDSAAFAVIQRTEGMRAHTWGGAGHQMLQGTVHALAALGAGWWIDRRPLSALWPAALFLFALAVPALHGGHPPLWTGPLYAVAVSLYSVALVSWPVLSARGGGPAPRIRAAAVYGVGGWLASGLGVGMAQELHTVPPAFVVVAAALVLLALYAHRRSGVAGAPWLSSALLAGVVWPALPPAPVDADPAAAVARGARVYREEGCIHCHSQFVRPGRGTPDAAWWGPATGIDRAERPPMPGNRRQGPDLLHVGLRRGPEWLRRHFLDPAMLSPGSRMPAYDHLFSDGSTRGEDLVAYLSARGQAHFPAALRAAAAWPGLSSLPGDAARGATRFRAHCAVCHGDDARGAGRITPAGATPPGLNLRDGLFLHAIGGHRDALARVIRFGLPGSAMPAHTTWSDQDLADVTAWLLAP